jgi:hypothetical protein
MAWLTALKGAGLNRFGEVESGAIRVRGKLLSVPADFVLGGDAKMRLTIHKGSVDGAAVAYCCLHWTDAEAEFPGRPLKLLFLTSGCNLWKEQEIENDG